VAEEVDAIGLQVSGYHTKDISTCMRESRVLSPENAACEFLPCPEKGSLAEMCLSSPPPTPLDPNSHHTQSALALAENAAPIRTWPACRLLCQPAHAVHWKCLPRGKGMAPQVVR
jgi:hypothetical protein